MSSEKALSHDEWQAQHDELWERYVVNQLSGEEYNRLSLELGADPNAVDLTRVSDEQIRAEQARRSREREKAAREARFRQYQLEQEMAQAADAAFAQELGITYAQYTAVENRVYDKEANSQ